MLRSNPELPLSFKFLLSALCDTIGTWPLHDSQALEPERITCPSACLTYGSSCWRLPRTRSQPSSDPHGQYFCNVFYRCWVWLYTFVCVCSNYLHPKAVDECAQHCTRVMIPVPCSSEGAVSALEKPDSSITLRHCWMPGLVGFILWAIIQFQDRSGFNKGS